PYTTLFRSPTFRPDRLLPNHGKPRFLPKSAGADAVVSARLGDARRTGVAAVGGYFSGADGSGPDASLASRKLGARVALRVQWTVAVLLRRGRWRRVQQSLHRRRRLRRAAGRRRAPPAGDVRRAGAGADDRARRARC